MDEILSLPETAAYLKRPVPTLRDWRARGIGPRSFRLGGRIVYKREDLLRWIEEQYQGSGTGAA